MSDTEVKRRHFACFVATTSFYESMMMLKLEFDEVNAWSEVEGEIDAD